MTSRPGPGIGQVRRRPSQPVNNTPQYAQNCIDPSLSEAERRPAEETLTKNRGPGNIKVKAAQLDKLHTVTHDAVRLPPRGKPLLFFSSLTSSSAELPLQSPHGQSSTTSTNLPVPPRPGSSLPGDISQQPRILPGGTGVKDVAIVKAPSPDAPPPSIIFAGGSKSCLYLAQQTTDLDSETADFFPWTGSHPEDTLSEALVKGGISNKPQIMNETNTARPSLWTNLKNKAGLSNLSTLFVAVLEKRQACGRLTTPNTFKPPPRLTLRDSTREAWLHDLANPTVGLRRLSRTIPHGITGKVLLDQCLNKNIPIPRAMWLAKCVGINEMRSHKRKGQAGTITWVRGWTSSVEQFLDSTIATIGQLEWKPRITYA
jgi:mediator of RNA polymerase II transcription subunit 12